MKPAEYYINKFGPEKAEMVIEEILSLIIIPKATKETFAIYRHYLKLRYDLQKITKQDVERRSVKISTFIPANNE